MVTKVIGKNSLFDRDVFLRPDPTEGFLESLAKFKSESLIVACLDADPLGATLCYGEHVLKNNAIGTGEARQPNTDCRWDYDGEDIVPTCAER